MATMRLKSCEKYSWSTFPIAQYLKKIIDKCCLLNITVHTYAGMSVTEWGDLYCDAWGLPQFSTYKWNYDVQIQEWGGSAV